MLGDFAHCNVNLCESHGEHIHGAVLWHGYSSSFDSHACSRHIVSSFCTWKTTFEQYHPFSFIGISQTLPSTSYIKMIDIWMIFTMICPFTEILLVWLKDVLKRNVVHTQGWLEWILIKMTKVPILCFWFCLSFRENFHLTPETTYAKTLNTFSGSAFQSKREYEG